MKERKKKYAKKIINEVLDELTTHYNDFGEYKNKVDKDKNFFVYHNTSKEAVENIKLNGADGAKEFYKVMARGRGIYTTFSFNDACHAIGHPCVVKFMVKKGAFNNFLIFDKEMKKKLQNCGALTLHEKISQTMERLLTKEDFEYLQQRCRMKFNRGVDYFDERFMDNSSVYNSYYAQSDFLEIMRSGEGIITLYKGKTYHSEARLDRSKIDGYCYHDGYGEVALFRATDILFPVKYYEIGRDAENGGQYCVTDEGSFDRLNYAIDAFRRARRDYPDTNFTEKTVAGFALVKKGNKYNFISAITGKYFSPIDFDQCETFDPVSNTAIFTVYDKNDNVNIEFEVYSNNNGRNIEMNYRIAGDETWTPLSYSDYISIANELKKEGTLNEVFTHKNYDEFKKYLSDNKSRKVFLYRSASPETSKSEFLNGPNLEYIGTKATPTSDDSLFYGFGLYTVYNPESLFSNKYGSGVCKFLLKDGFKDFLILNDKIREQWYPGKTCYDQLVELVPPDLLKDIDNKFKSGIFGRSLPGLNSYQIQAALKEKGIEAFKNINVSPNTLKGYGYVTASFARALKLVLQGRHLGDPLVRNAFDELIMSKTKIRGFVYDGGSDGGCVFVRDLNSLMPVAYSVDRGRTFTTDGDSEERFNKINQNVHPWYQYKSEYNKMGLRDKQTCGFSLVKGEQGMNYKDIWFHRQLLPVDVENAETFDVMSKTAQFTFLGITFEIELDNNNENPKLKYMDDGMWYDTSYEEFMQLIGQAQEQGMLSKDKKIYQNNLLNPNVKYTK